MLIVPSPFRHRLPAIATTLQVAIFHEFYHGLCATIPAVPQRLGTTIRHAALIRCKFDTPPTTIAAGRAVWGSVFFFEIAQHAVHDVAVIVCHRRLLPFHNTADAKPAKRSANKKEQ
jgi:hypothetical protein